MQVLSIHICDKTDFIVYSISSSNGYKIIKNIGNYNLLDCMQQFSDTLYRYINLYS